MQETLRHQRLSGERLGSTLVAEGIINEDSLMDFLAKQTGVPRMDVKNLEIPLPVLQRIPRRLAEQMNILPVVFKEPKSLVLAMADPMDLNAVDSARFASGLNIEPVVAGHTALRQAIADQYARLASWVPPAPVDPGSIPTPSEGLPVPFELMITPFEPPEAPSEASPFSFFTEPKPALGTPRGASQIIHQRSAMSEQVRPLEGYGTRALVLGLIRMLQRRSILGQDELQHLINTLVEAREIDPDK
ncbi:MAG: hypothetical protein P4L36_06480 [Holophaga sp.]|nr:hypothetical protein [Holophaga sp.]